MELLKNNIRIKDIITEKTVRNALVCDMALENISTNTVLHLLAIAHEAGLDVDLNLFNEVGEKVPNLCHSSSRSHHYGRLIFKWWNCGGFKRTYKKRFSDTDVITVTEIQKLFENSKNAYIKNTEIIRTLDNPYSRSWWTCNIIWKYCEKRCSC